MDSKNQAGKILMLPWLAHGHLSPFLELSKKLIDRNFQVYFCSTPINLNPIRANQIQNKLITSIQFIEINLPSIPEIPPNYHTTKNLPPHLMPVLKTAFDQANENFREIIRIVKPDLLVYDFVQPWAPEVANQENVEAVVFMTYGVAAYAFLFHYIVNLDNKDFPIQEFDFPERKEIQKIIEFMDIVSNGLTDEERFLQCVKKSSFLMVKSLDFEIESKYADYFSSLVGKEVIPVGSLVQDSEMDSNDSGTIIEWLNKRDPYSVVFVSFGTEYFLSKDQIEAIAIGLELSSVSFIWVIRFPGGENRDLREFLPKGFQKRVEERCILVQGWAPQAKILSHPSIGGFVSHCGWSSTLESIKFGVPIIAMPMQLDQPLNARFVVNIGVGLEVQSENENLNKDNIARVIREVVFLEEGKEVRKRVEELSAKIKEKGDQEIDLVAKKLLQFVKES